MFDVNTCSTDLPIVRLNAAQKQEVDLFLKTSPEAGRSAALLTSQIEEKERKTLKNLEDFLSDKTESDRQKGKSIFKLIFSKMKDNINVEDLTIEFESSKKSRKGGNTLTVNLRAKLIKLFRFLYRST